MMRLLYIQGKAIWYTHIHTYPPQLHIYTHHIHTNTHIPHIHNQKTTNGTLISGSRKTSVKNPSTQTFSCLNMCMAAHFLALRGRSEDSLWEFALTMWGSGCQAWCQAPLPAKPSRWPKTCF